MVHRLLYLQIGDHDRVDLGLVEEQLLKKEAFEHLATYRSGPADIATLQPVLVILILYVGIENNVLTHNGSNLVDDLLFLGMHVEGKSDRN